MKFKTHLKSLTFTFSDMYMCICVWSVHLSADTCEVPTRASGTLELELQGFVSCLTWEGLRHAGLLLRHYAGLLLSLGRMHLGSFLVSPGANNPFLKRPSMYALCSLFSTLSFLIFFPLSFLLFPQGRQDFSPSPSCLLIPSLSLCFFTSFLPTFNFPV